MRSLLFVLFLLPLAVFDIGAAKFVELQQYDGVVFSYKWKNSKFLDRSSPMVLVIKATNTNNYMVETTYTVDYFWQGLAKASSGKQVVCIKPKMVLIVRRAKSSYSISEFTNEEILNENFIFELSGVAVVAKDDCGVGAGGL